VTLGAWLAERSPAPPPRLAQRIHQALGVRVNASADGASALCVDAAADLLRELLSRSATGRESALELLAVDALVTYAFEAAAASPASLTVTANAAMARLSLAAQ
jgi:hypothetical protein